MITPAEGFPASELDPAADPRATPRPEEEVADAVQADRTPADREPAAGGSAVGEPAQGEGEPDSH